MAPTLVQQNRLGAAGKASESRGLHAHDFYGRRRLPAAAGEVRDVAKRVRSGGHGIPETTIRRRFDRGLTNFRHRYRDFVDRWVVYDASTSTGSDPIAEMQDGQVKVHDADRWSLFEESIP